MNLAGDSAEELKATSDQTTYSLSGREGDLTASGRDIHINKKAPEKL